MMTKERLHHIGELVRLSQMVSRNYLANLNALQVRGQFDPVTHTWTGFDYQEQRWLTWTYSTGISE